MADVTVDREVIEAAYADLSLLNDASDAVRTVLESPVDPQDAHGTPLWLFGVATTDVGV